MDLQHPLRSLIPSRDWAVLEVLAATQSGLGASRIAQLSAKGSRTGQITILDRLVEHGLVLAEPANHGFTYRLNRDHLLTPAVLSAAGLRATLLARLVEEVARLTPTPQHASVFGSFARGDAGHESDIDVLLLADSEQQLRQWEVQIDDLQALVQRWTGNRCSCLTFTVHRAQRLAADGEPIVDNWRNDALVLFGEPLDDLLQPVRGALARHTVSKRR